MRRAAPRPLDAALADLRERLAPATPLADVQAAWAGAVGDAIAGQAQPVAERDGTVTVACRSSVWAQELDLMSLDVVARLNSRLGRDAVARLRCVTADPRTVVF